MTFEGIAYYGAISSTKGCQFGTMELLGGDAIEVTVFGAACDVEGWRDGRVVTKEESCSSRRILEI